VGTSLLLHQAFDRTLKYCQIAAKDLADVSGVSTSRISQFRNGRGSDLTSRAIDDLLNAANNLHPQAKQVFAMLLSDQNPEFVDFSSSWQKSIAIDSMDTSQISQLLVAIADRLDGSNPMRNQHPELLNAS
jgi:transcriptional regulator with XRE-family HTH domain